MLIMHDSPFFPLFLPFIFPTPLCCITMLLPATPPRPSLRMGLLLPCCAALVRNGSSNVKSTETLIPGARAHGSLEIRISVRYTRLLAERSGVTGSHGARARGSDLELQPRCKALRASPPAKHFSQRMHGVYSVGEEGYPGVG